MAGLVVVIRPTRGSSTEKPPPTDACRQICVTEVVGGPSPPWGVPPLSKLVTYCARMQGKKISNIRKSIRKQVVHNNCHSNKWCIITVILLVRKDPPAQK